MLKPLMIVLLIATTAMSARTARMNIQQAIQQKKVKATVKSLGGHQGYCLSLSVQNLSPDSLIVLIEAGRRFVAGDPGDQDILIVKQEMLVLRHGQTRSAELKGYCCQASDRSPSRNAKYTVGNIADSALFALAQRLNRSEFERDIEQQAIWAISDKKVTSSIPFGTDSCAKELRKFVALLKHEPIPWYTMGTSNHTYGNGFIEQLPTYVAGTLKFTNGEECYGTFSVVDTAGSKVAFMKSEWLKPGANQDYAFKVPVAGLKRGKYFVQITKPGATLVRREFEI